MAGKRLAKFGSNKPLSPKRRYRVETTEKSRMAGKRRAKFEKKALPRVETTEKSRMAGKRRAKKALPRVELGTFALRVRRSTAKLQRQ